MLLSLVNSFLAIGIYVVRLAVSKDGRRWEYIWTKKEGSLVILSLMKDI
jgi:hypothetical protein